MKITLFFLTLLLSFSFALISQANSCSPQRSKDVKVYSIYVATNKTTTLVFSTPIKSFTIGCQDIKAVRMDGSDNVLQVKALAINFRETNLIVVIANGATYSFIVNYSIKPMQLVFNYDMKAEKNDGFEEQETDDSVQQTSGLKAEVRSTAVELLGNKKRLILGLRRSYAGIILKLRSLDLKKDVLYMQFECENKTDDVYDIDSVQFYIRDQFKNVLNVIQQVEINPLIFLGNHSSVLAHSSEMWQVAVPKFVIPYLKYFAIDVKGKNEEKHLTLKIGNELLEDVHLMNPDSKASF